MNARHASHQKQTVHLVRPPLSEHIPVIPVNAISTTMMMDQVLLVRPAPTNATPAMQLDASAVQALIIVHFRALTVPVMMVITMMDQVGCA